MKTIQTTILYNKYKDLILLNKNIIVAGICAFFSAAFVTQSYYTQYNESHIANSVVALISEYILININSLTIFPKQIFGYI